MDTNAFADGTSSPTLLVVDDDDGVRDVLADGLRGMDYAVLTAASGEEALDVLAGRTDISLLITDVRMPGLSGLELAERVQRERPALKVILISGYFDPRKSGTAFLRKPFRMKEMHAAVQAALSR